MYSGQLNMSVTLASTNLDLQQKLTLHPGNSDVVQSLPIPTLPTGLFVSAVGDGCALLQVTLLSVKYEYHYTSLRCGEWNVNKAT